MPVLSKRSYLHKLVCLSLHDAVEKPFNILYYDFELFNKHIGLLLLIGKFRPVVEDIQQSSKNKMSAHKTSYVIIFV